MMLGGERMKRSGRSLVALVGTMTLAACDETITLYDDGQDPTASYYDLSVRTNVDHQLGRPREDAAKSLARLNTVMQARTPFADPAPNPGSRSAAGAEPARHRGQLVRRAKEFREGEQSTCAMAAASDDQYGSDTWVR